MLDFFGKLFSADFMPHGHCYLWRPEIVWLHVISDGIIALAYYCIPIALWYLIKHRKDLAFNWMFACFAGFIFLCGTTHLLQIWTLWNATYRFEGLVKAATAAISLVTAALLIPLIPKALRIPTARDLEEANHALARQVQVREQAEEEVRKLNVELEQRVEERTAALVRSNEELAQFAYVASHDLQEPLRMVSSYTQLLKIRYRGKLDESADEYIDYAVQNARRMQSLIEDLLAYSRVDHGPAPTPKPFQADSALDEALQFLRLSIQESGAIITRDKLPMVCGDVRQLAQVFQNLIGNSVKYRSERAPEIHIGLKELDGEWLFWVKDNGIGLDPAYADRIFGVFKRLHGARYPGTGIGLSIARKIIMRHGGRIWCESRLDEGATFYFTLPKAQVLAHASLEPGPQTAGH